MSTYTSEQTSLNLQATLPAAFGAKGPQLSSRGNIQYWYLGTSEPVAPSWFFNAQNKRYSNVEWNVMLRLFALYCWISAYDPNPNVTVNPAGTVMAGGATVMLTSSGTLA